MPRLIDLTGQKFGRLLVIKRVDNNKHGQSMWLCLCSCGIEKIVCGGNLNNGNTQSCRCLNREKINIANTTHGHRKNRKMSKTYQSWSNIIQRCTNPNHKYYYNYGGREITVCERWMKFENFLEDMGELHIL